MDYKTWKNFACWKQNRAACMSALLAEQCVIKICDNCVWVSYWCLTLRMTMRNMKWSTSSNHKVEQSIVLYRDLQVLEHAAILVCSISSKIGWYKWQQSAFLAAKNTVAGGEILPTVQKTIKNCRCSQPRSCCVSCESFSVQIFLKYFSTDRCYWYFCTLADCGRIVC